MVFLDAIGLCKPLASADPVWDEIHSEGHGIPEFPHILERVLHLQSPSATAGAVLPVGQVDPKIGLGLSSYASLRVGESLAGRAAARRPLSRSLEQEVGSRLRVRPGSKQPRGAVPGGPVVIAIG